MNKRIFSFLILFVLVLSACKPTATSTVVLPTQTPPPAAPTFTPTLAATATPTPTPAPTSTPTPTPTPVTASIGVPGGELTSADGRVQLVFPADAVQQPLTVSIDARDRQPDDGDVLSPIIEIAVAPEQPALDRPALLSLLQPPETPGFQFARLMHMPGQLKAVSGDPPPGVSYWLPLPQTRLDESGQPVLPLARFSTYAPYTQTTAVLACIPSTEDLAPPPTPEGYVYIGVDVVINKVYQAGLSTTPLTRQGTPQDLVYIKSRTEVKDAVTTCDIIVGHIFAPIVDTQLQLPLCQPDPADLAPPETPAGFVYVGVDVTINSVWDEELSTVPLDRADSPDDLRLVKSSSVTTDQTTQCDVIVSHLFAPSPRGPAPAECVPNERVLQPPLSPMPEGYVYLGREVVINQVYSTDYSTAPLGRPHSASDMVMLSSSTTTRNGVLICDMIIAHVYARLVASDTQDTATQDCVPTAEELAPPPAPEGYVYVGVDVVVNGVWDEKRSTVSLERPESPQDVNVIRGHTQVQDGVTTCDVIVRHLFAPASYSGCTTPSEMLQMPAAPPCHRYVGVDVMINYRLVKSTVPLDRPFKPTDAVHISSKTTTDGGQVTCDIVVAHTFEPIPCPPCETVIPSQSEPSIYTKTTGVSVYFGPCAQLADDDKEKLIALSITPPYIGEDGGLSVTLPPGATVSHDGKNVTIKMSNCP